MPTATVAPELSDPPDRHFDAILKGAVGVSVLLTAATGTLLGAFDHGIPNILLYVVATVGALLGAVVAHIGSHSPR